MEFGGSGAWSERAAAAFDDYCHLAGTATKRPQRQSFARSVPCLDGGWPGIARINDALPNFVMLAALAQTAQVQADDAGSPRHRVPGIGDMNPTLAGIHLSGEERQAQPKGRGRMHD